MPVSINSRYRTLVVADSTDARGQIHPTIGLRLLTDLVPATLKYRLIGMESLEFLAWRQFGNSQHWWRIADANPRMFPLDWAAGNLVRLPTNSDVGKVQRTRGF